MAHRRRTKGALAQNANSEPENQAPASPAPRQQPSGQKQEQRRRAKPKPSDKITKPADTTSSEEPTSQKKRRPKMSRQINMSRSQNDRAGPAPKIALLPLRQGQGQGHVPPKQQIKNNNRPRHQPKPKANLRRPSTAVLPWDLDPQYPRPLSNKSLHSFNYNRPWHSLKKDHVREELQKHLDRGRRAQLPALFPDSTDAELAESRETYCRKGQPQLYETRKETRNAPVSSAPLIAPSPVEDSEESKSSTTKTDNRLINGLLGIAELRKAILDRVGTSIGDVTALAATCTEVAALIRADHESWDFNSGTFPTEPYVKQKGGVRTKTLVVGPLSDETKTPEKPYMADFENLIKFYDTIATIPWSFRHIVLDQIPYLDVATFEMMVNSMPNLETVTITRCQLLDITKLKVLLDVIKRHPRVLKDKKIKDKSKNKRKDESKIDLRADNSSRTWDEVLGVPSAAAATDCSDEDSDDEEDAKKHIELDFYPYFFHGPNSAKRLGSYGVTYNEPTFHSPKAVFGTILQCWDLAQEVGMDLVSDSSSFWSFVRQLPGPDTLWAVKARDALITREHELAEGKKDKQLIHDNFADDITAALTGDDYKPGDIPYELAKYRPAGHHAMHYWRKDSKCGSCGFTYPMSFYPIRLGTCWSCKMTQFVDEMEDSHLRHWQISAMQNWARGLNPATATLQDLLTYRSSTIDKAISDIRSADSIRDYFLKLRPGKPYCPPTPASLDEAVASLARWRWHRNPATSPFDYRQGGPQHQDPCKEELYPSDYMDEDFGAESLQSFTLHWSPSATTDRFFAEKVIRQFNNRCDRDPVFRQNNDPITSHDDRRVEVRRMRAYRNPAERAKLCQDEHRIQNSLDKNVYTCHHARVEDSLVSLFTTANKPFNLDQPAVHASVEPDKYQKIVDEFAWVSMPYSSTRR